jgi:hypothetical protein
VSLFRLSLWETIVIEFLPCMQGMRGYSTAASIDFANEQQEGGQEVESTVFLASSTVCNLSDVVQHFLGLLSHNIGIRPKPLLARSL